MRPTPIVIGLTVWMCRRRQKLRQRCCVELGNTSNVKWFRGIGECRIDWGPGYRIYLAKDGETLVILFGGGTKKGQQADIE